MDVPLLFVGQADRTELQRVLDHLRATSSLVTVPNVSQVPAALPQGACVRRILLAPSFRDEFPPHALRKLNQEHPLAEVYVLVGPWIEGETRSGNPWLAAQRLYLHQVVPWLRASRTAVRSSDTTWHSQWRPATLSADEAWQLAAQSPWPTTTGCVALCSELPESRRSLAAICRAAGLRWLGHDPEQRVECADVGAVVYDAVSDRSRWERQIRHLADGYQPDSLVVLVNFPRPDECEWMLRAGATEVLGKPFQLDHLVASLVAPPGAAIRAVA